MQRPLMPLVSRSALFLALALLSACQGKTPQPAETLFDLSVDGVRLRAELAVTGREMQQGLMFRDALAEDTGMLFVYRGQNQRSFYMKNTRIPLDIGFFDGEGVLREVRQMEPFDETSILSRSADIQFALEMNQGWFERRGIRTGARLDLEAVGEALRQRGFNPAQFGI